jgi:hypothetical protein
MYTIAAKFTSGGPHEKHVVATWNHLLLDTKTKKNLCRGGRSQDLPDMTFQRTEQHKPNCETKLKLNHF